MKDKSGMIKLSIIIPCFNSQKTLLEAVQSCYMQGFDLQDFEVVIVDDASSDATKEVIEQLLDQYSNVKAYFHDQNMGGGAARNTAVSRSVAPVIFCLDSDDILPSGMLRKMYEHLLSNKLDGILFSETRFFEKNINETEVVSNKGVGSLITFWDLYETGSGFLTQVNFMYTSKAFGVLGGYPVSHGFDTQGFGFNFLAQNLRVAVCPETYYFHRRQQAGSKSYYEREYEKGLLSINTYLCIEKALNRFDENLISLILNYDIFKKNTHGTNANLHDAIAYSYRNRGFAIAKNNDKRNVREIFIQLCNFLDGEDYLSANESYVKCLRLLGVVTPIMLFMQLRIAYGLMGVGLQNRDKFAIKYLLELNVFQKRRMKRLPSFLIKFKNLLVQFIPKNI
ncbi:glycosyltransferase family 2 protein [Polynucleobacter sp. MWH-CaK5]|uniref:glycosyltransferase family 2 protein n=1 Tax=Polynucleobacter sp. MWH-CaK5 TaxID=2689107 RepID=UPI001BFE99A6|nr:glycosyltransferase family 2 protein [Polynucleobacter sp. MWH-CaK5]QWD89164.1 glycosyltransferase family 2 protein [Polynucleobacter sp. MWH-CaK5]